MAKRKICELIEKSGTRGTVLILEKASDMLKDFSIKKDCAYSGVGSVEGVSKLTAEIAKDLEVALPEESKRCKLENP